MDSNQSRFWYIFFVFVGFVITIAAIHYMNRRQETTIEKFEITGTSPSVSLQQIDPEEVVADLPRKSKLALYLTSFSEPSTFQCDTNYWCDAVDPNTKFFVLSDTTLPTTLTPATGLPLNGIKLRGPSAYTLSPTAPHILNSFTLAFYAKINSLSALDAGGTDPRIHLFELPAESPHRVELYIRPTYNTDGTVDTTKAVISCTFGDGCTLGSTTHIWEYDRNTLISTVNTPTLFALVFDKENKNMKFYAGISATPQDPRTFANDTVPEVRLGISEMTVNKNNNWDANLVAFAFYNLALSLEDLRLMDRYFMQHSTGYSTMVRAKETLESEIQDLMSRLNTGEDTIKQLLDKLNAANQSCKAGEAGMDMAAKLKRWQISMQGNSEITGEDLGKCSILSVKSFGAKAAEVTPTSTTENGTSTSGKTRKYNIPYPSEVSSSTPSVSIYNDTRRTTTTAPTSPSSPVDQDDPNGFWKSFFDFMKSQKEKTDETEEKADLNKAYDQLRDEVDTDRTQPGSGEALKASVQDPPKEEEPVEENKSGFWATIKGIFSDL